MSEKLTFTIHELVSELDTSANSILTAKYGVTVSQFVFLAICADLEPTDVTHLAKCLAVSKAAVSKRVPSMVSDGWIVTSDDPNHGRRVVIELTERARDLIGSAGPELEMWFMTVFDHPLAAGIDPTELNRQLTILTSLVSQKGPFHE